MAHQQIINRVLPAHEVDMGGMSVLQPLPTNTVDQIDPFLLLHHHEGVFQPDTNPKNAGVGPHPHRGFSPVTFVFQGDVHHRDSRGNSSIVAAGGVQWMNAGMGITHSERPSKALAKKGGTQEILQLWINTPAAKKMNQPVYQAINKEEMPKLDHLEIGVVSGTFLGVNGPAKTEFPITTLMGTLRAGQAFSIAKPAEENAFLYLLDGAGSLSGFGLIEGKNMYRLVLEAVETSFSATEDTRFIYVAAKPLGEKVESYGPFVMNSQTEIMQAMRDYQMGKMGILIEEF